MSTFSGLESLNLPGSPVMWVILAPPAQSTGPGPGTPLPSHPASLPSEEWNGAPLERVSRGRPPELMVSREQGSDSPSSPQPDRWGPREGAPPVSCRQTRNKGGGEGPVEMGGRLPSLISCEEGLGVRLREVLYIPRLAYMPGPERHVGKEAPQVSARGLPVGAAFPISLAPGRVWAVRGAGLGGLSFYSCPCSSAHRLGAELTAWPAFRDGCWAAWFCPGSLLVFFFGGGIPPSFTRT